MRNVFGWDLPPGCSVSDIPGNQPEDIKQEAIEDEFFEKEITDDVWKLIDSDKQGRIYDAVCKAIWYGYEIGLVEQQQTDKENKFYDKDNFNRTKLPKLRKFFKEQRYLIDYLKSEVDKLRGENIC